MTYEEKIKAAKDVLSTYNSKQSEEGNRIEPEKFETDLAAAGGVDETTLGLFSWEDLMDLGIPEGSEKKMPKVIAKSIANIFRSKEEESIHKPGRISSIAAERKDTKELLEAYDPRDADAPVGRELAKRSKGKPFIVFNPDNTVDVTNSLLLFEEIRDGFEGRTIHVVEGKPQRVYKVGHRPDTLVDQNPLYPEEVLYRDGICGQTNRSWKAVSLKARAIIYLAVTRTKEIVINQLKDAHDVMDLVVGADAENKINNRCPQAAILYGDLEKQGSLPSLKLMIDGSNGGVGGDRLNNPFGVEKHQTF